MKNRFFFAIASTVILLASLCGCGSGAASQPVQQPQLNINWDSVVSGISSDELAGYGWFADMDALLSDAEELGTVTFCNYDPCADGAFKEVDYQLTVDYGLGCEYAGGAVIYYEAPVYTVLVLDNSSDSYYTGTYSEDFTLLYEEGDWFLAEEKDTFISGVLADCSAIIFGN